MLQTLDYAQQRAMAVVAVEQRLPRWWYAARARRQLSPEDRAERDALVTGLTSLAKGTGGR